MHNIESLKSSIYIFFVLVPIIFSQAQDRCGTVVYQKKLQQQNLFVEDEQQFEQWIKEKLEQKQKPLQSNRTHATYTVPVVVHVIYKDGDAIGTGTNISDAQILSQISVLNKDYNRQNTDASNTPADFLSVAGSINIEFVLAKSDPEGLSTNGIVRVKGTKSSWTSNDNYQLKSLSYWPAEDYLNIWVCDITDFLGYAQLPQSTILQGLENASTNRLTDGVVINYKAFGSMDDGNFNLETKYNKGRTATHEIGHFFGLRHIWGDVSGCGGTDYVNDTPNQSNSTSNCPTHPRADNCSSVVMFQNYLDYTNDACMNLFTVGQVDRMKVVLDNSPRRKSLLTSPGSQPPQPVANDLGVRQIISPATGECSSVVPQIEIRNYGSNAVTSAEIQISKNGVIQETKTFPLNLGNLESTTVNFSSITLTTGSQNVAFEILQTNGNADGNPLNNSKEKTVTVPGSISIPFTEAFNSVPSGWRIFNPDDASTWKHETFTQSNGSIKAMKMDFFNYEDNLGEIDLLITPKFDLTSVDCALLLFDVAYAQYTSPLSNDALKVVLLENCDTDINQSTIIYAKSGSELKTTNPTSNDFTPATAGQWRTESRDLSAYLGKKNLQLAFVGVNDWGNNLYLDNVKVIVDEIENVSLKKIISPAPITCTNQVEPVLLIQNLSCSPLTSFKIKHTINGNTTVITNTNLNINPGAEYSVKLPRVTLPNGENKMTFEIIEPNNKPDQEPSDNSKEYKIIVDTQTDKIPFFETFETNWENRWTSVNPYNGITWGSIGIDNNTAIYFNGFNSASVAGDAWLVSPILNFSKSEQDTLFFTLSYARRQPDRDTLQVLASTDCANSFSVLQNFAGPALSDLIVDTGWVPAEAGDWQKKFVPLKALDGKTDVRIAFLFKNYNGNNIYIDSIRIGPPFKVEGDFILYPNPAANDDVRITFNLKEKEKMVRIEVIDGLGKTIYAENKQGVHYQTYQLPLQNIASGLYFVRVRTLRKVYVHKLVIK